MSLSIIVRQTRNHLATDVQYIASKRVIIPDPLKIRVFSLKSLGFVKSTQQLTAISPGRTVISRSDGSQIFLLDELRKTLTYDEKLSGPTLTVIEIKDLVASQKWKEARQKEERRASQILRLKSLLTLQCVSAFWKKLKLSVGPIRPSLCRWGNNCYNSGV